MYLGAILITAAVAAFVLLIFMLISGRSSDPAEARVQELRELSGGANSPSPLRPAVGGINPPSVPNQLEIDAAKRERQLNKKVTLRDRLVHAGLYTSYSPAAFAIARLVLAIIPLGIGLVAFYFGKVAILPVLLVGGALAAIGTLAPSFWLDYVKVQRQKRYAVRCPMRLMSLSSAWRGD
jgi:hypothetical protein